MWRKGKSILLRHQQSFVLHFLSELLWGIYINEYSKSQKWNTKLNVLSSIKVRHCCISITDQINALGGENKTRTNGGQTLISSFLLVKLSNSHKWGGHRARKVRKKQKPSKAAKRIYTKWGRVGIADLSNNSRRAENQWWIMWRADLIYASGAVCAK